MPFDHETWFILKKRKTCIREAKLPLGNITACPMAQNFG